MGTSRQQLRPAASRRAEPSRAERDSGGWSLRTYLVVTVAALVVLVVGALVYGYVWSARQATEWATDQMAGHASRAAESVSDAIETARAQIDQLAAQPGLVAAFEQPEGCSLLASGVDAFPVVRLGVISPDGMVGCSSDSALASSDQWPHRQSPWLQEVLGATSTIVVWEAVDAVTGLPAVVVASPFMADGRPAGVVAAFLGTASSAPGLLQSISPSLPTTFTVIDQTTGAVVSLSDESWQRSVAASAHGSGPDRQQANTAAALYQSSTLLAAADVPGTPWRVYAAVAQDDVLASARGTLGRQAVLGLLVLLVLAAITWMVSSRIVEPLRSLAAVARRVADGDGDVRAADAGPAEVADLSRAINTMLDVRAGHEARLAYLTTHDDLTGLPNSRLLRELLEQMLDTWPRVPVVVLRLGFDLVPQVNDGIGPTDADRTLAEAASWLAEAVRPHDIVARSGDHDFVIACLGLEEPEALQLADRLRDQFGARTGADSRALIHVSIGIAIRRGQSTAEQLIGEAHTAMTGSHGADSPPVVFDPSMQNEATRRVETELALSQALERDELMAHYQPLVDVESGHLIGVEALVRWAHPTRGMIPPLDFIPIAEATGQIAAIGTLMLRRTCAQGAAWAREGHRLRISVNVAAAQLRAADFADHVLGILHETGLPPDQLCLEVTESTLVHQAGNATANLHRLRSWGVHLAIDDFGTGYSSLAYLKDLPVDELKIDRSFVARLEHDTRSQHLVQAVIRMADALDLSVVAEGIETQEQLAVLRRLGCHTAQGYFFARPQPAEDVTALLLLRLPFASV